MSAKITKTKIVGKLVENRVFSILPIILMGCMFLAVVSILLGEKHSIPVMQQTCSPDAPIEIIDPATAFIVDGGISPNTADIETLCIFHGVGEKTAQAFIIERELNGPFIFPEDILAVKGIGEKKLENIRPLLTLP